jgi:hypothetical protein
MLSLLKSKETQKTTPAIPEGMTLQQVHSEMLGLMAQVHVNHHRMGLLYNYVVDKKLAEKAGFKDTREFLSKHLADLSQSALSMYGAVAATFSEPVTRRYGITCLYLLLTYKEAVDLEVNAADPGNTPIEVPDEKGQVTTQPFGKCSVEQMRRALMRKRKPASTRPLPAEAEALAEQYRKAVVDHFPPGVRVKVLVRNEKGKAVLDFKGIPVESVGELAAVLKGEKPMVRRVE